MKPNTAAPVGGQPGQKLAKAEVQFPDPVFPLFPLKP
jgi:hypothetical protein